VDERPQATAIERRRLKQAGVPVKQIARRKKETPPAPAAPEVVPLGEIRNILKKARRAEP
jgi:hypothetical protein